MAKRRTMKKKKPVAKKKKPNPKIARTRQAREHSVKTTMQKPRYPLLQQNTLVWLTELSGAWANPATLDDIPDAELDRSADLVPER